jgi:predicted site-specific integrase-resolvase
MKRQIKLSEYALKMGITYKTAHIWWKAGKIANAYMSPSGSIFITEEEKAVSRDDRIVIYARVSNQSRRAELQYQVQRCLDFCAAKGLVISDTYYEVASGMNDKRSKLWKMLESNPTSIVIENKDRLTRFGFNYLERLLQRNNCKIIVMNDNDNDEQDLMKDLVAIITSFCCRLYGLRRVKNKIDKIKKLVTEIKET